AVQHTFLVRAEADAVLSLLKDAETGQRGFLITGAPTYLEPYETALASLPSRVERLRQLTADNATQQANLTTLDSLIQRKASELRETVAVRQDEGFEAVSRRVDTDEGKRIMDSARVVIATIDAEEDSLLAERQAREDQQAHRAVVWSIAGLAAAITLLGLAT